MDRQKKILDNLMKNNKKYKDDPYAREFGINVSGEVRDWALLSNYRVVRYTAVLAKSNMMRDTPNYYQWRFSDT